MAANKPASTTVAVAASAGNLLNPPTVTGGVNAGSSPCYILIRHMRVVNKSAAAVNMSAFIGATGGSAAGTEFVWATSSVPAYSYLEWYGCARLDSTQFLTGLAGTVTTLVLEIDYEIGIA